MRAHLGTKIDSYLDGRASPNEEKEIEVHLRVCESCRAELKRFDALALQVAKVRPEEAQTPGFKHYWKQLLNRHQEVKTMTAIQRVKRVVESNIHSAIDALEDPEKMIKQLLREMEASISNAREEAVQAIVLAKGLHHRHQAAQASAKKWEDRAALALQKAREDLAREALREQLSLEGLTEELRGNAEAQDVRVSELKKGLVALQEQLENLKRRKSAWLANARRALEGSRGRQTYQTAYRELGRILESAREQNSVREAHEEIDRAHTTEETLDALADNETLEKRIIALKKKLSQ